MEFEYEGYFWWAIPLTLAGMGIPNKEILPLVYRQGIRTVISLLEKPLPQEIYQEAGLTYWSVPIKDKFPPSIEQAESLVVLIEEHLQKNHPVAVHCIAGWGRTGTLLACYLISKGKTPQEAIAQIRAAQPHAIETKRQEQFLYDFEQHCAHNDAE